MESCECEDWAEFLFEPEEALNESEREGLACHLSQCDECSVEREMFLDSWSALDDVDEELEPCPLLRAKVWQKIREEENVPRPLLPSLRGNAERAGSNPERGWRGHAIKLGAAAAAIILGFGVGRSVRSAPEAVAGTPGLHNESAQGEGFLDPDLIQLASQEGFSVELFPESTQFTPIDREMMTALAPAKESREWMARERGAVVPLQYISQGLPQQGRKAR